MESDWRAGGLVIQMGIIGEIFEGYWRGIGEIFEGYWRGIGEIFEGYWRGIGEIFEGYWRGIGELVICWLGDGGEFIESQHQFYCTFFPSLLPGFGYTS